MIHRSVAISTVFFVAAHIATLIPDPYAKLSLVGALVPGMAETNTLGTALGSIAFLVLVAVAIADAVRRRISPGFWKFIHAAAFAVWPLATVHFIMMGTDVMTTAAIVVLVGVTGILAAILLVRGFASGRPIPSRRAPTDRPSDVTSASRCPRDIAALSVVGICAETPDTRSWTPDPRMQEEQQ